jgi:hypothetical protein
MGRMKKKKKRHVGAVQGFALLYGRSSRAIRIVNGEIVGGANKQKHSHSVVVKSVKRAPKTQNAPTAPKTPKAPMSSKTLKAPKKYIMSESIQKKLDNLRDPLAMMTRYERAQKYESANQDEKYEYGLSDW